MLMVRVLLLLMVRVVVSLVDGQGGQGLCCGQGYGQGLCCWSGSVLLVRVLLWSGQGLVAGQGLVQGLGQGLVAGQGLC